MQGIGGMWGKSILEETLPSQFKSFKQGWLHESAICAVAQDSHHFEILNKMLTKSLEFLICTGPHDLCGSPVLKALYENSNEVPVFREE